MNVHKIEANSFTFDCIVSGVTNVQNPIVFLHGWPETAVMWKAMINSFVDKGYYCIAPYLRGYSEGARPKGKKLYHMRHLVDDVLQICDKVGLKKIHLVGHDWGAAIAWQIAYEYPEKIKSLVTLSVPHTKAFGEAIKNDPEQAKMSKYMKQFQTPLFPEFLLSKKKHALLKKVWDGVPFDIQNEYLKVFGNFSGLKASLNYYRANYKLLLKGEDLPQKINTPTLFCWGKDDPAIGAKSVERMGDFMDGPYRLEILNAKHFIVHEKHERLVKLMLSHFKSYPIQNES